MRESVCVCVCVCLIDQRVTTVLGKSTVHLQVVCVYLLLVHIHLLACMHKGLSHSRHSSLKKYWYTIFFLFTIIEKRKGKTKITISRREY